MRRRKSEDLSKTYRIIRFTKAQLTGIRESGRKLLYYYFDDDNNQYVLVDNRKGCNDIYTGTSIEQLAEIELPEV